MSTARTFFDRTPPSEYLEDWRQRIAAPPPAPLALAPAILTFSLGPEWLALPATLIQEITNPRPIHRIPHRHTPILLGLVNIRGILHPAFNLAPLLGIPSTSPAPHRLLLLTHQHTTYAIPADTVGAVHRPPLDTLHPPPPTHAHALATYTTAILPWREHSVGLLDHHLLLHTLDKQF